MWENQVELLTKHCQSLSFQLESFEKRIQYLENVLITLLVALKEGGVLVDSDETPDSSTNYSFD